MESEMHLLEKGTIDTHSSQREGIGKSPGRSGKGGVERRIQSHSSKSRAKNRAPHASQTWRTPSSNAGTKKSEGRFLSTLRRSQPKTTRSTETQEPTRTMDRAGPSNKPTRSLRHLDKEPNRQHPTATKNQKAAPHKTGPPENPAETAACDV